MLKASQALFKGEKYGLVRFSASILGYVEADLVAGCVQFFFFAYEKRGIAILFDRPAFAEIR